MPPEIVNTLNESQYDRLHALSLLIAIPEYRVSLPGGAGPSRVDVMALMRNDRELVPISVEGKADETFGPTVGAQRNLNSPGVNRRLEYLEDLLGLEDIPDHIRYQLLHRTASAILIAREFHSQLAVTLVESFGPNNTGFNEFQNFVGLFHIENVHPNMVVSLGEVGGIQLYIGWCQNNQPESFYEGAYVRNIYPKPYISGSSSA